MQSIFWPSSGIVDRFDVKGCLGGRFEDPKTKNEELVLKDQNFYHIPISLGQNRAW